MTLTAKLFSFEGRLRRLDYWLIGLSMWVLLAAGFGVLAAMDYYLDFRLGDLGDIGGIIAGTIVAVVGFFWLWISLALQVKRCHDLNITGWLLLIGLIPYLGGFILGIMLGFIDGTKGPNSYGRSPKGIGDEEAAAAFA